MSVEVLVVGADQNGSEEIASVLEAAHYSALVANGLEEGTEALELQSFGAVLITSEFPDDALAQFCRKVREVQQKRGALGRIAIIGMSRAPGSAPPPESCIDVYIETEFSAKSFEDALSRVPASQGGSTGSQQNESETGEPLFEPDKFQEQVAYDQELLVEIIDLFLAERKQQVEEMQQSLAAGDFEQLSRLAHTIKGSLGSLRAMSPKAHAERLEVAAKKQDRAACEHELMALGADLERLEPLLLALRSEAAGS